MACFDFRIYHTHSRKKKKIFFAFANAISFFSVHFLHPPPQLSPLLLNEYSSYPSNLLPPPPLRHSRIILIISSKIFVGKLCVYCVEFWNWESFHAGRGGGTSTVGWMAMCFSSSLYWEVLLVEDAPNSVLNFCPLAQCQGGRTYSTHFFKQTMKLLFISVFVLLLRGA